MSQRYCPTRRAVAALLSVCAVALSGCGGDDEGKQFDLFSGDAPSTDQLSTGLHQALSLFRDMQDGAPAAVKPSVDEMVETLEFGIQALDRHNREAAQVFAERLAQRMPEDTGELMLYRASNCFT